MRKLTAALATFLMCLVTAHAQDDFLPTTRPGEALDVKYVSPRIQALGWQVASGEVNTDAFWSEVEREGTPLVELIPGDADHLLVTFLWRGEETTKNVLVLLYPFTWVQPQDYQMTRVAATDVWHLVVRMPRGARFSYGISPDDPVENPKPGVLRNYSVRPDPLNPHRWASWPSMVELPGAMPQSWIVPKVGTPLGRLQLVRIPSQLLGKPKDAWLYTPPGYQPEGDGEPYPLVVAFDGAAYRNLTPTPIIMNNMIAASKLPPAVAVLVIADPGAGRVRELSLNPTFAEFTAKELVPWVRSRYRVTRDPRQTLVAGSSEGGLEAALTAFRYPEVFGNVLCQSGDFDMPLGGREATTSASAAAADDRSPSSPGWMIEQFRDSPKLPLRFFLAAGTFEVDTTGSGTGILASTRELRDVLRQKGYDVQFQQFVGGHDYLNWRGTFADGLQALLGVR